MSTTKTISTAEEVIYTPEDTLPAVPAASVKQLRALNTNGESVNVSPDTLRELTAIDHSLLTEQVVPGAFWLSYDRTTKKQLYTITVVMTYNWANQLIMWGVDSVKSYSVRKYDDYVTDDIQASVRSNPTADKQPLFLTVTTPGMSGKWVVINLEYTKK